MSLSAQSGNFLGTRDAGPEEAGEFLADLREALMCARYSLSEAA